jgi:hypothetical protein
MRLSVSIAARNNSFSKAMRRIRPKFSSLFEEFASKELENPIHEAILLGVTDSLGPEEIEVVPNEDGFFQVICGFGDKAPFSPENDAELATMLFNRVRRAVELCPFSRPDAATVLELLQDWSSRELRGTGEA